MKRFSLTPGEARGESPLVRSKPKAGRFRSDVTVAAKRMELLTHDSVKALHQMIDAMIAVSTTKTKSETG